MGRSESKVIVYLIISAVVIILIKLWLHYTSWLPIATIRTEEQAREKKCLSPAKKYKLYKSSINKSIHFVQRSLSSSTRG